VAHHLRADLDQLLLQARQRPVFYLLRRRQRAREIAEIVGQRMKLVLNGILRTRMRFRRMFILSPLRVCAFLHSQDPLRLFEPMNYCDAQPFAPMR
jgi:hypothetical protein